MPKNLLSSIDRPVTQGSLPSLRLWLLSTTLLAVVAGHALLLVVNRALNEQRRLDDHQQLVASLSTSPRALQQLLQADAAFGWSARVESSGPATAPQLQSLEGRLWLQSRSLLDRSGAADQWLLLRQDVTESIKRQRQFQWLLVASAGSSVLLTASLLRLVLWRGLALPLDQLNTKVAALQADSLGRSLIDSASQPLELQPMAEAFNDLQGRLALAWRQERSFVDGVVHELRTPISVMSGHLQQWQQAPASPHQLPLLAVELDRMTRLLQVMLDLARSDADRLQLDRQMQDPEELLLIAFERLQPLASARLQLSPPAAQPLPLIWVDLDRVQQCIAAIVRNALAYSDGKVRLDARLEPTRVVLHVVDQGPGIPVSERQRVVQRFQRGSTATGIRGSGLGLALVDQLMRLMGGELVISDDPGGGADLQLRFPRSA